MTLDKAYFLRSLLVLNWLSLFCSGFAKEVPGVIYRFGDSAEVTLSIPVEVVSGQVNFQYIQTYIKYRNEKGKIVRLRPEQGIEVRFKHKGLKIRMVSIPNTLQLGRANYSGSHIFLQLMQRGPVSVYSYEFRQNLPSIRADANRLILFKNNQTLMWVKRESFRKDMSLFFGECSELAQKIRNGELKRRDIYLIVGYYNDVCAVDQ